MPSRRIVGALLLSLLVAGCARSPSAWEPAKADAVLSAYRTKPQISEHVFALPERCVRETSAAELCLWRVGGGHHSWEAIGRAVGTSDRVNLICRLPVDGGEREDGSCAAYPRRSDRGLYRSPSTMDKKKRVARARRDEELRGAARRELDAARDLAAVVALVGDLPSRCDGEAEGVRTCLWTLDALSMGHGTVAQSAGIPLSKQVRLLCSFDASGSLRGEAGCGVRLRD